MSQMMEEEKSYIWHIRGLDLELDLHDADTMELYEKAFAEMSEDIKKLPKDGASSQIVKAYCRIFKALYDRLFGNGTSEQIFGEKNNIRDINEVYDDFLEFVQSQQVDLEAFSNRLSAKYSPNRAQRRAAERR